eukprot:CAMPEP_0170554914 /NCGR_PEP_ID=MMETSP0211-20121228/12795_1 /TAXON_ID=311385 /ORGANISM="Pseudokeronopsis sp., Strain OXSARD2" /LENGTH=187 /DNA_ID=CAMNT_0010864353 /DNA_START=102 /DNA_END=665 /DNA_ORIENTATION=+
MKPDLEPSRGARGDPYYVPPRYNEIMKKNHEPVFVEKPRFIRDQMNTDDIHGTKSRRMYMGVAKDILNNKDIMGSQTRVPKVKEKHYDLMDYRDVNGKKGATSQVRDPLNPVYLYRQANGGLYEYGEIEGNKPKLNVKDMGRAVTFQDTLAEQEMRMLESRYRSHNTSSIGLGQEPRYIPDVYGKDG